MAVFRAKARRRAIVATVNAAVVAAVVSASGSAAVAHSGASARLCGERGAVPCTFVNLYPVEGPVNLAAVAVTGSSRDGTIYRTNGLDMSDEPEQSSGVWEASLSSPGNWRKVADLPDVHVRGEGGGATGIALDGAGTLYVGSGGTGGGVYRVDPAVSGGNPRKVADVDSPAGIALDGHGKGYVSGFGKSGGDAGVFEFDLSGKTPPRMLSTGLLFGLAMDGQGRLFGVDLSAGALYRVDPGSGSRSLVADGMRDFAMGVTIDRSGTAIVTGATSWRVDTTAASSRPIPLDGPPHRRYLYDVALGLDTDGNAYAVGHHGLYRIGKAVSVGNAEQSHQP